MLIRLTYASHLASHCGMSCIENIIASSAPGNRARGITGILAIDGSKVLQILEGPEAAVIQIYDDIRKDARHHGVIELDRLPIDIPHFKAWGMVKRSMTDAIMFLAKI